jgi:peptidoglycan hydrolase-like protein with peptidoglycan-binding domain
LDEVVGRIENKSLNTQEYKVVYDTYISLLSDSGNITNTPISGCEDEYTSTNTGNGTINNIISQNINMPCLVLTNFMEKNSSVPEVAKLQTFLTLYGYMSVWPTGFFGLNTEAAVKTFQANNGIDVRGWAGPATRSKVAEITCKGDINAMNTARRGVVATKKIVTTTVKTTTPLVNSNTIVIPETNINTAPIVVATTTQLNTIVTTPKLSTNSGTFYVSRSPVNSIYFSYQNAPSISPTYICTERTGESNCSQGQNFREVSAIYDPTNFDMIPSGSKWLFTFYAQSNVSKAYFKSSINSPVEVFTFNYSN